MTRKSSLLSLNPCCGGRCSSTFACFQGNKLNLVVLILVVVEDVLVLLGLEKMLKQDVGLNPCCGGRCSSTSFKKTRDQRTRSRS